MTQLFSRAQSSRIDGGGWSAERWASLAPWVLVGYVVLQCVVRLLISPNLEWDEAQFVGHIDFRLGYGNSQGPLYNWIVGLVHSLSGSWSVAVALPKHVLLAATYVLQYDLIRRLTGSAVAAAAGAFALLLIPQIVLFSEVTLAHTVLVQAAVTATLHAIVLVLQRASVARCIWLGAALSAGILTKYNFLIVIFAVAVAALVIPEIRARVFRPVVLVALAVAGGATIPHLIWAAGNSDSVVERLSKLSGRSRYFEWLDLPSIGVDGALSFAWGVVVAIVPLFLVWRLAQGRSAIAATPLRVDIPPEAVRRFFLFVWIVSIAAFAIVVVALDAHRVLLRYVTPLIMAFPVWIGLAWPVAGNPKAAGRIVFCAAVLAAIVAIGWPIQVMVTRGPLNYPYAEMAEAIARTVKPPYAITSNGGVDQNLVIRLDGTVLWKGESQAESVLVVVREDADIGKAAERLGEGYAPVGAEGRASFPNYYFIDKIRTLRWQMYERQPGPGETN